MPLFPQRREKTNILRALRTDVDDRDLISYQLMSILVYQELWKERASYLGVIINTAEGSTHQLTQIMKRRKGRMEWKGRGGWRAGEGEGGKEKGKGRGQERRVRRAGGEGRGEAISK